MMRIAEVIEPSGIVRMLGGVARQNLDITLKLCLVRLGTLPNLAEPDAREITDARLVGGNVLMGRSVISRVGRQPKKALLGVRAISLQDHQHIVRGLSQVLTEVDSGTIEALVGVDDNRPIGTELGCGAEGRVPGGGKVVGPWHRRFAIFGPGHPLCHRKRVIGCAGVDHQTQVDPVGHAVEGTAD